MNYGWKFMTLYSRQGSKQSPRKRNAKKKKIPVKRTKEKKEKRKDISIECRVPKNSQER